MSQWLLECESSSDCTMTPYTAPPATVEHYTLAPGWAVIIAAIVVVIVVIATAIVRYNAHVERNQTERVRIQNPLKQCPTCGDKLEAS